ncbi:MAG: hypothetical protein Fur002_17260 [Anaerolineales bacterium]
MKTKLISIFITLLIGLALFSCGTNNEPPAINADAIRTEAVQTFAAQFTQTAKSVPTLAPTLTLEPTLTLTPTPEGGATATATKNACYNLLWIKDLTIPDGSVMKPNEVFTKTWLVQNNGGCAWAPGFTFSNVGGDPMRGATVKLTKPIPVGLKYELSVELVVPSGVYGVIQSAWRMAYEPDMYFGDTLFISIVVEDPNAPSPTPAAAP